MAFGRFHADFHVWRAFAGAPPVGEGAWAHVEHAGQFGWREQIVTHGRRVGSSGR